MKQPLLIILLTFSFHLASAQLKGFSVGPYAERAWPQGKFAESYHNGLGAGVSADIKLPGKLGLTGSLGFLRFGGKDLVKDGVHQEISPLTATPIRIGIKYRLPLVYLKFETGTTGLDDDLGRGTIISPGAGIRVLGMDVQVKYETWFRSPSYSLWGLKST